MLFGRIIQTIKAKKSTIIARMDMNRAKRLKLYTSIDFMPVWNFFQVTDNLEVRYLIKNIDYENLPKTTKAENDLLELTWVDIIDQFIIERDSNEWKVLFRKQKKMHELDIKLTLVHAYLMQIVFDDKNRDEAIKKINQIGSKYNVKLVNDENLFKNIEVARKRFGLIKNEAKFLQSDLKTQKKENKKYKKPYSEIIDYMVRERGVDIDLHKTTVKEYIGILRNHERILQQKLKENG